LIAKRHQLILKGIFPSVSDYGKKNKQTYKSNKQIGNLRTKIIKQITYLRVTQERD
jgi:hypothetical protein